MMDPFDQLYERMLVARCQLGDADAFAAIVDRYQVRLRYFLRKTLGGLGNASSVDDLLQDVWLNVFRSLPRLNDPTAFPAWIYRIARDRAYQELRQSKRAVPTENCHECAAPADVSDESFSTEEVGLIHDCLNELTQEHREALVLRFLQDMSYESIAAVVDCSVGTVRSRLHYAKKSLRSAIDRRQNHE